ncbi:MAG TPA: hypothetical protein VGP82_05380 [Ktedonobacterales bacterium]|jgi:hypothetical protein|nr:hypothetical protein [Ktedonobacterales bacterium]
MDRMLGSGGGVANPDAAGETNVAAERLRCSICRRRLGDAVAYLEETGDQEEQRQSWVLCENCNDAVKEQMAQVPIRSPMRLRVAIALVSTERTPAARRMKRGQLTDEGWTKLLFWTFVLAMLAHLAVIVFVAGIAR